jgi:Protein of unknown function (DUF3592)
MPSFTLRIPAGCGTRLIGALFALPLVFMAAAGARGLYDQHWRLRNYVPVEAVVLEVGVQDHPTSRGGSVWEPMVRYGYQVQGTDYQSRQVLPVEYRSSEAWAARVARPFQVGQRVTAYHHPRHPERAFLVRERGGVWVWFILIPLALIATAGYVLRRPRA